MDKFFSRLTQHNPFTELSGDLVSLHSVFISEDNVNCDNAYEIGEFAIDNNRLTTFPEIKLKRKDMVVIKASYKSVTIHSKGVVVNSELLFNRILCVFLLNRKCTSYMKVFTHGITDEVPKKENIDVFIYGGLHCVY